MKKVLLFLSLLIASNTFSIGVDTLKIKSNIKKVTLFFNGAQTTREATINLPKGKHLIVVEKLPSELNPQSIQIEGNQQGKILSVKHSLVYPDGKNKTITACKNKIKQQTIKIKELKNKIDVYNIEEKILLDNSNFSNKTAGTTISEIKEASAFYRIKLNEIRQKKLDLTIQTDSIKEVIQNLYVALNKKVSKEDKTFSKISFIVNCKAPVKEDFKISYFVASAGWSPLYDFRVTGIDKPLNIVYNAAIFQSTGEDWKNVKLTLSSNNPSLSNKKPELKPWFINREPVYEDNYAATGQAALSGIITDAETGEPIPFANITISQHGAMIAGTTSDFDGKYTIKPIKPGNYDLIVAFLGYVSIEVQNVTVAANTVVFKDFPLQPSSETLDEVMIIDHSTPSANKTSTMPKRSSRRSSASKVNGVRSSRNNSKVFYFNGYKTETTPTSIEYNIDTPYTILSDGNDYTVQIKEMKLGVNFVYYAVPKLEKDVFLIAEIYDWSKLNLLSGKASTYYKGTYTGETDINVDKIKDTLRLSLNRDRNIIVERTLLKEKNEKQFIGKNIKETINRSITVKNNKNKSIKIIVEDQFPISENKSVVIERLESSNGRVDDKTGKVVWNLALKPGEKKELTLKYSVKYPNRMHLNTE